MYGPGFIDMIKNHNSKTILLVEDEMIIALEEKAIIGTYGYNVIIAPSGEEAIRIINSSHVDLILMDINLGPGMDGTSAADIIMSRYDIPVIFLSSHTERDVVEKTEGITSYGYIVKNAGEAVLIASIKMAFRLKESQQNVVRKEQELKASEEQLSLITDSLPVLISHVNSDLQFLYVNKRYADWYGKARDEIVGRHIMDIISPESREGVKNNIDLVLKGKEISYENISRDGEGEIRAVRASYIPHIEETRAVKAFTALVQDITKQKKAEEEVKRLLEEKDILLKEAHHRIKNTLSSMASLLSLKARSSKGKNLDEVLQDIIGFILSNKLLYDKLLITEHYDTIEIKKYFIDLTESIVSIHQHDFVIRLDEDIEEITLHSKIVFPLGIILTELLTNIMKYAFNDTLDARITIKVSKNSEKITMIVEDNGRGLPPDLDTENPQGFGLTLVKMLTMQINGTFSIRSSNGTRSIVEFPL